MPRLYRLHHALPPSTSHPLSVFPVSLIEADFQPSSIGEEHRLITPTGVKSYDVSLDTQTATVVAAPTLEYETVLRTIAKTGKKVNSGEADGETRSVEVSA